MALSEDDVLKIAKLAAIDVSTQDLTKLSAKLSNVLDLFAQLEQVNTDGVKPMAHPLDQVQRLRLDQAVEVVDCEKYQALAPACEQGLYLVPKVIE
ncbi:Asp-tRNA(Asn)/Glu-tRNA(Gln) amidotransferase subunit GatC [Thiomicrospira cyclica]|jgi:aspartyl-tRNA(Asn)/glutamyl-tRNA(Gln) amidotransferase subunit C|uniref:Aspartyl/glutamyl-tRNA(Asn/Gln) amidotransferase subunit C n=1 Tax=Thiomicrospira cyclica (strain DSM 14477 / JCM 11371 / ALM1) TaxID=717773 RepID=F6D990_THICA|nr:Asp-tRNA(Asn)/Glu-tRNA(Gln) amidotransferase subunit GatC [Thiomicrospira cyclica]AEG32017.1 Aspartyl/glutamyl-tRNA(Asn/Gln) amidotransferase subunit C [Thiomicrospira cyclica ALM1]